MSLKHIMLGLLRNPQSGYDIKNHFEQSLRNFWRAELSQIYPLLNTMESEGLLTSLEDSSDKGPPRRVYKRAPKGRKQFEKWLSTGPVVGTERVAYLAQIYFLGELHDSEKAIAFMEEMRNYFQEYLDRLAAVESNWRDNDPRYPDDLPDDEFFPQLTLQLGLARMRTSIGWCDDSIRRLRQRANA